MSVTQVRMASGSWSLRLIPQTPQSVLDSLQYFGHVAVSTGREDVRVAGDSLLRSARYVGVLRKVTAAGDGRSLSGPGMAMWLGDEDKKGPVVTSAPLTFTAATFTAAARAAIQVGQAAVEGTLHSVTGAYTGVHQWQTSREVLSYICSTMSTDADDPVEWRINGDATVDAGKASQLFTTDPVCVIMRGTPPGVDARLRALPGQATTDGDVADYSTEVALLAQGDGQQIAIGGAILDPGLNPYKDLRGNPVRITRLVSESTTDGGNAAARAAMQLGRFTTPRKALNLSTTQYDIEGDLRVGDWVWCYDPDVDLVDLDNEVVVRGRRINPVKLRVTESTWPITAGMTVGFRGLDGTWQDLTPYVQWESGSTTVVVGGYDRSLTGGSSGGGEQLGSRAMPNTSIPAAPTMVTPFRQAVYQSSTSGVTKAQVEVAWTRPPNTDGSTIVDGDHYEVQYRTSATPLIPVTWAQLSQLTWGEAATWGAPIPYVEGPWQSAYVQWDSQSVLIQELTPGIPYDIRVRAIDNGAPANAGTWSAVELIQTVGDTFAPSPPAPPEVATSRMGVQIVHRLGRADGGEYNLESDLHHLEIHAAYEPTFTPTDGTLIGKLLANAGMITAGIPAVGTMHVESVAAEYYKVIAVDEHGNKSPASAAVVSTATLIDNAHISDLTVSKVTAGTITATWIMAGSIKTANSGARTEFDNAGLRLYNAAGQITVNLDSANGNASLTGTFSSGRSGERMVINPNGNGLPEIYFYPSDDSAPAYVNALYNGSQVALGLNSGPTVDGTKQTTLLLQPNNAYLAYNDIGTNLRRGGFVEINDVSATMAYAPVSTQDGGFLYADANLGVVGYRTDAISNAYLSIHSSGQHSVQGTYWPNVNGGGLSAVYCGLYAVAPGFNAVNFTYGATMQGRMCPIVSAADNTGNNYAAPYNPNAAGFSVGWANSGSTSYVSYWVFRIPL